VKQKFPAERERRRENSDRIHRIIRIGERKKKVRNKGRKKQEVRMGQGRHAFQSKKSFHREISDRIHGMYGIGGEPRPFSRNLARNSVISHFHP
jgi:hypothetical protein